jgi:hypothetical protein
MKRIFLLTIIIGISTLQLFSQPEKLYLQNKTPEYNQVIAFYNGLDADYPNAKLLEYGPADCGLPLQLFVIDPTGKFDPKQSDEKVVILINNGIHPGESCGVDASMNLAKEILESGKIPENVIIAIIPLYNIGRALNRNNNSRTNQNGPEAYGFRGNAKNLDLNRDFIKADSRNARAFIQIFREWKPEIFVDTHTSNGADYQYVFTLLSTQKDKLNPVLGSYLTAVFEPYIYKQMAKSGFPITPYVDPVNKTPDNGLKAFLDVPRFSTGYAALFNAIGFTTESHMLKTFPQRVKATLEFLQIVVEFTNENADQIIANKKQADQITASQKTFPIAWKWNDSIFSEIIFMGYEAEYKPSKVSGGERLYYNRDKPYVKTIPLYRDYDATILSEKPKYYIIPQAWQAVIALLKLNKVEMIPLKNDTTIEVQVTTIEDYNTSTKPYESHYLHYNVNTSVANAEVNFRSGDILIPMGKNTDYFTVSVLEAQGVDSYFAWNYFDGILQQKEWFSAYVFEDEAEEILNNNPALKEEFEMKLATDSTFKNSSWARLYFIYENSAHFENSFMRYPVYRVD